MSQPTAATPYPQGIAQLPELSYPPTPLPAEALAPGWQVRLPVSHLTEEEIVHFGKMLDPQPIHIDPEYGKNSSFGTIIASGLHPYIHYHTQYWVPLVKEHFISGLSWDGVKFEHPILPNQAFYGVYTIHSLVPKPEKGTAVLHWLMDLYRAADHVHMQRAQWTVYHRYPHSA